MDTVKYFVGCIMSTNYNKDREKLKYLILDPIILQCYLPIHVFWDQDFSVNLKSVNSKFTIFLPIHCRIVRKTVNWERFMS